MQKFTLILRSTYDIHFHQGLAGQISSLSGPHLARGPYVVNAWYRERQLDSSVARGGAKGAFAPRAKTDMY